MPASGGWVIIIAGTLVAIAVAYEYYFRNRRTKQAAVRVGVWAALGFGFGGLTACSTEPQAIRYNQDACSFCKMTISDPKFAAELVTKKGKVFMFDDVHCLTAHLASHSIPESEIGTIVVTNYQNPNEWVKAQEAYFVKSEDLHSPMGGNSAAVAGEASAKTLQTTLAQATLLRWDEIKNLK